MLSGDDEFIGFDAIRAIPRQLNPSEAASPAQAMQDMVDIDMIDGMPELRDSEEENEVGPPVAKRSRL